MGTFRTEMSTTDSEQAMDLLSGMYSGIEMDPHPDAFALDISAAGDERFSVLREAWTSGGRFQVEPQPIVIVVELVEGAWDAAIGRTPVDTTRPSLYPPSSTQAAWDESFTVRGTQFDAAHLDAAAAAHFAKPGLHVHFTGNSPISLPRQHAWEATTAFVRDTVCADDDLLDNDLIRGRAFDILAAALLVTFPNNTLDIRGGHDGATALPATVRRAIAFMEEHISEPIRLEDIAAVARLSPRGLQAVFQRVLGATPTRVLRDLRLEAARTDLRSASPDETVTIIAHRWGFVHVPRFAAAYHAAFGENPSQTLRG